MDWHSLWWLLVGALVAAGLLGAVLPVLPGPLLLFLGLWLAAWIEGYQYIGDGSLIALACLMVIAHSLDTVAGLLGAKASGASRKAVLGAMLGGIAGLFFGLPGLVLGPAVGALVGELSHQKDLPQATRTGIGTGVGVVVGMAIKVAISFTMIGWYIWVRYL